MIGRRTLFDLPFALLLAGLPAAAAPGRTFIFHNAIRNVDEFRAYARQAARLKPYGRVLVDIGVLAEKSPFHVSAVRSPWHDYGAYMATPWAFVPPPKMAPHVPPQWVAKNRALLVAKAAVLREYGLQAVFRQRDAIPAGGVLHEDPAPARSAGGHCSRKAEFAWCVDEPETLEMIEWMMAALKTLSARNRGDAHLEQRFRFRRVLATVAVYGTERTRQVQAPGERRADPKRSSRPMPTS